VSWGRGDRRTVNGAKAGGNDGPVMIAIVRRGQAVRSHLFVSSALHRQHIDLATIMPPQKLKLAVSQSRTLLTLAETLEALKATTQQAAKDGADLVLFPEAYLGGCVISNCKRLRHESHAYMLMC